MADSEEEVVAVIMVGGPTKGTRFRPLSFNTPKPLFPLAGQPMVHHHISACRRSHIFLLNCDVCCSFPLPDMLQAHKKYGGMGTIASFPTDFVRLDQDILSPLAGKKQLYTYETMNFWEQIKTPGMSLKCSALYLAQYQLTSPQLLASGDGTKSASIIGDVYVHPSAKVHPTAKIGPNVSISANVRVGAGVRLISCIILDDVEIQENAVVMHSIIGWKSSLGRWSRVQADGDYNSKLGITILGEAVTVEDEVVVTNCIVLPNKIINGSVQEEIIL
ncbi:hypothetical protein GH714_011632 [Hevea brasiliensis]|uniref:Uncharacterized protein n=1 Tax=Hevea brasiliensis TaxID=3981 RepID=A0A6A6M9K8_HEVBR|nr:hypothetical protein GH714_011632 [Hevea brasiliensis]